MGRPDLADKVDVTDVDPELEGRRRDECPKLTGLQPRLRIEPFFFRQASMMRRHRCITQAFGQVVRKALRHVAGVHEDQRGPMRLDERCDAVVGLLPDLV